MHLGRRRRSRHQIADNQTVMAAKKEKRRQRRMSATARTSTKRAIGREKKGADKKTTDTETCFLLTLYFCFVFVSSIIFRRRRFRVLVCQVNRLRAVVRKETVLRRAARFHRRRKRPLASPFLFQLNFGGSFRGAGASGLCFILETMSGVAAPARRLEWKNVRTMPLRRGCPRLFIELDGDRRSGDHATERTIDARL